MPPRGPGNEHAGSLSSHKMQLPYWTDSQHPPGHLVTAAVLRSAEKEHNVYIHYKANAN